KHPLFASFGRPHCRGTLFEVGSNIPAHGLPTPFSFRTSPFSKVRSGPCSLLEIDEAGKRTLPLRACSPVEHSELPRSNRGHYLRMHASDGLSKIFAEPRRPRGNAARVPERARPGTLAESLLPQVSPLSLLPMCGGAPLLQTLG